MSLAKQKISGIYKKKRKFCEFSLVKIFYPFEEWSGSTGKRNKTIISKIVYRYFMSVFVLRISDLNLKLCYQGRKVINAQLTMSSQLNILVKTL